ncbi:MAG: 16S rRNA (guanine(966)-N(2))-methyltransferase RsmD [Thermodesulfobacteria bacterium]|nr:16S rRNA (guanine(966)-N(2))-methyltransferase RsmD [Thermodesulfobacteriota bacterium]
MRITSGRLRGLRLKAPKGADIRPMMDRVRKALFDVLGEKVEGARVLDLFCGTGALGIEALSRGAGEVVFVDQSPQALALVRENLRRAKIEEGARIKRLTLPRDLSRLEKEGPFDLVFVTPPYGRGLAAKTLPQLPKLVAPGGLVVVEERAEEEVPCPEGLELLKEKTYGATRLFFFRRPELDQGA